MDKDIPSETALKKRTSWFLAIFSRDLWASIFGWNSLFRWDVLGAIVPGIFLAFAVGVLGIDWFPHNLLISQICVASCSVLSTVKTIRHAAQHRASTIFHKAVFCVLICAVIVGLSSSFIWNVQSYKNKLEAQVAAAGTPAKRQLERPPSVPNPDPRPVDEPLTPRNKKGKSTQPNNPAGRKGVPLPPIGFEPESPKAINLPEKFTILNGGGSMTVHRDSVVQKNPDDTTIGFTIEPSLPLRIYMTPDGRLRADVTLFNSQHYIAAVVHGTKFDMEDPTWDANYDDDALEIIDDKGIVRFQLDRLKENLIRVEGFFESDHSKYCADDNEVQIKSTLPLTCSSPTPIFKYPKRFHLHERMVPRRQP